MKASAILAAITAALLPSLASAHYLFPSLILNGVVTDGFKYVREHDNGFQPYYASDVLNLTDFRCNKGSENHRANTQAAKVVAGKDVVGFQTNLATKIGHPGPMQFYMSKAPGLVKDYDGSGDWFKVHQIGTTGTFGGPTWDGKDDGWLALNQNQFTFKLPAELPAGQYLLRIEHMAVHPPYRAKQFFFQCGHLDVQSSYTGPSPSPVTKFPGAYRLSDPALMLDSWAQPPPTFAAMPGPPAWPDKDARSGSVWH